MRKQRTALDNMKVKYDKQPINIIETAIETAKNASLESRRDFIHTLFYLDQTKRFRENPSYKKATFAVYIGFRYHLRPTTYQKEKIAFLAHEKHTLIYGPGLVSKIRNECGPTKVDEVFSKLTPDDKVQKIEKTIKRFAKPKKVVKEKVKTEIPTVIEQSLRERNIELEKRIVDQDAQIFKLKATVERLKTEKNDLIGRFSKVSDLVSDTNPVYANL